MPISGCFALGLHFADTFSYFRVRRLRRNAARISRAVTYRLQEAQAPQMMISSFLYLALYRIDDCRRECCFLLQCIGRRAMPVMPLSTTPHHSRSSLYVRRIRPR